MKINWQENSTKRGIVWIITAIIGVVMILMGKDISQLMVLAAAIVGGMGLTQNDTN
jgi:drug/metabolite transporter (DMT)-like permease